MPQLLHFNNVVFAANQNPIIRCNSKKILSKNYAELCTLNATAAKPYNQTITFHHNNYDYLHHHDDDDDGEQLKFPYKNIARQLKLKMKMKMKKDQRRKIFTNL